MKSDPRPDRLPREHDPSSHGRSPIGGSVARCGVLVALTVLAAACGDTRSPIAPAPPPPAAQLTPTDPGPNTFEPSFPSVPESARVYVAASWPYNPIHGSQLASRYVLYDDGSFALQYSSANYPFFEYLGRYFGADGDFSFQFDAWNLAGPWEAAATVTEETLTVRYNIIMQLADFEDGVYLRMK